MGSVVLTAAPTASMAGNMSFSVESQQENDISPYMMYIRDAISALWISGTTATVDCSVLGTDGVATKAKVIAELQLKSGDNWLPVKIWTATENDCEAYVYDTYKVKSGNIYRVKATVTVWEGNLSETQYVYSGEQKCN